MLLNDLIQFCLFSLRFGGIQECQSSKARTVQERASAANARTSRYQEEVFFTLSFSKEGLLVQIHRNIQFCLVKC